ncbi:hypothetical protein NQ315_016364 [Exocentrus adspersus]|uniref:Ammonium transporter AmtB-like domain-containing protein n=1 Tax=Exocentrus adspersus TaxID=1586481 RepID=A0AAV8VQA7_9CUCU|nr:hypothetical protein NQ315_016364 [Exocentrus adspersus]
MNSSPISFHQVGLPIGHERDYYDLFNEQFLSQNSTDADDESAWTVDPAFRGIFALLSRIGFILIEVGSVPVGNVYTIVAYNLVEMCLVLLSYGFIGNWLAFGATSAGGWIGFGGWDYTFTFPNMDAVVVGFCACLMSTAQMSSFLAGRIHMIAGMVLSVFYSAIFQPILMHWIWSDRGWMKHSSFLGLDVSVKDHAGGLAIHLPSAIFGATGKELTLHSQRIISATFDETGALFLGRRIMKLRDIDELSFGAENVVTTIVGYTLVIFNYITFALPSPLYAVDHLPGDHSAIIVTNSFLALAAGILIVAVFQLSFFRHLSRYRRMVRCVQGGMAGLVTVASAVDIYTPLVALLLPMGTAAFFFLFAELLHHTALEDACSLIPSHLICSFIGVMLCPLLAQKENLGSSVQLSTRGVHLLWQFICTLVVVVISVAVALFIFLLMKITRGLRNEFEAMNHKMADVIKDVISKRSYLERLFATNSSTEYVEPGYRRRYFDAVQERQENSNNPASAGDSGDTMKTVVSTDTSRFVSDVTVRRLEKERALSKSDSLWKRCGSGDYYDPFQKVELGAIRELTRVPSKTSWMGYNEV